MSICILPTVNWSWLFQIFSPALTGAVVSIFLVAYYERVRFFRKRQLDARALKQQIDDEVLPPIDKELEKVASGEYGGFPRAAKPKKTFPLWFDKRLETIQYFGSDFFHHFDEVLDYFHRSSLDDDEIPTAIERRDEIQSVSEYLGWFANRSPWKQALPFCSKPSEDFRLEE